jgi:DNA polymerase V
MTLAKLAARSAKRTPEGVWMIDGPIERELTLRQTPLDEIWGIGPRWAKALARQGIDDAWALVHASALQRSPLNRCGRQTVDELAGQVRFTLQTAPQPRKSARVSRTFGEQVFDEGALCEAMSHFASKLGARLRRHQLTTTTLLVSLEATQAQARPQPGRRPPRAHFRLSVPLSSRTADSSTLIEGTLSATRALYQRWREARREAPFELGGWRKGGVLALDLSPQARAPLELFAPSASRVTLSALEDQLNQRFGRQTAQLGATPKSVSPRPQGAWRARSAYRSPRYTSAWGELLTIDVDRVYRPQGA